MGAPMNARDLTGTNMEGIDHWNTVVSSAQECADLCDTTAGCVGATYVLPGTIQGPDGHCWRKSAVTGDTENFNCISFTKLAVLPVFACIMSNPKADFSLQAPGNQPPRGFAPLAVQFTDLSTGVSGGRTWDFGDGSALSHEQNPVHTYTAGSPQGTNYDVTLTVLGACPGESAVKQRLQEVRVFDNIGFLGLASTPPGASVSIDGTLVPGMTAATPGEPLRLAPGTHTVRLSLGGYKDVTADLVVQNGQTLQYSAVLEPAGAAPAASQSPSPFTGTGSLQVTTMPDGAAVTVDGTSRGSTPLTVPGLAAGSHTVRLAKAGFTDYTGTLTLSGGKTTLLNITLVAAQGAPAMTTLPLASTPSQAPAGAQSAVTAAPSGTGSLSVASMPPGANVYLDGEKVGTTPVTLPGVTAGSHRLLLTLQGYADSTQPVTVTAGQQSDVTITFPAKKTPGFAIPAVLAGLALALLALQGRRRDR